MKNLHKKISVVVLSGLMLLGGGLSQGLVANAISISLSGKDNGIGYEEFNNRRMVMEYGDDYKYEPEYLGEGVKCDVEYVDGWDFLIKIRKGDLEEYRKEKESIIIKVGKSCFRILFLMPKNQLDRIIMRDCSEKYDFKIVFWSESGVEVNSWVRSYLRPKANDALLKEPSKSSGNLFNYGSSFRAELELKKIKLEKGKHYRFRVGSRDYVIYKN